MVKNKALPDSVRPCKHPRLVILSLSLSLSLFLSLSLPHRLGPIKAGLMCLLSLSPFLTNTFIQRVPLDPAEAGPQQFIIGRMVYI